MDIKEPEKDKKIGLSIMQEFLHKCIRCNSKAFEVEPKHFRCSSCDFEWEML